MIRRSVGAFVLSFMMGSGAFAQELFVFPNDGQSQDQQDLDEVQCRRSATERTGFDPMATPRATRAAPEQQGGLVGGAARGALLGTAVGAVTGNTWQGAGIGAAAGGVMGGMRRSDSRRQQEQWQREQQQIHARNRSEWNRAFTACMEARGYTVR